MRKISFLFALFMVAVLAVNAQTDYYVVHGANENVTHSTHYPKAVGVANVRGDQQVLDNIASAPRCAAYFDKTSTVFKVKSGETLGAIAQKYRVTTKQIMTWNGLKNANRISIGQRLRIEKR